MNEEHEKKLFESRFFFLPPFGFGLGPRIGRKRSVKALNDVNERLGYQIESSNTKLRDGQPKKWTQIWGSGAISCWFVLSLFGIIIISSAYARLSYIERSLMCFSVFRDVSCLFQNARPEKKSSDRAKEEEEVCAKSGISDKSYLLLFATSKKRARGLDRKLMNLHTQRVSFFFPSPPFRLCFQFNSKGEVDSTKPFQRDSLWGGKKEGKLTI